MVLYIHPVSEAFTRRGFFAAATAAPAAADKPAILGGTTVRTAPFPSWPVFDKKEEQALIEVLRSGKWFRGDGKRTARSDRDTDFTTAAIRRTWTRFSPSRKKRRLRVVEDACQSNWSDPGCFSFQASKNLNSGEGGAIITNNVEANAKYLDNLLREIPGVAPHRSYAGTTRHNYHIYLVRYEPTWWIPRSTESCTRRSGWRSG